MFSDFWVGDGKSHHFWTKDEAVNYWTEYAEHFGCIDHIRLGAKVESVVALNDSEWEVTLDSGEQLQSHRLVLAIGNNRIPRYPDWRESLANVSVSHSKNFINARPFEGKRVLVVGGGRRNNPCCIISSPPSHTGSSLNQGIPCSVIHITYFQNQEDCTSQIVEVINRRSQICYGSSIFPVFIRPCNMVLKFSFLFR